MDRLRRKSWLMLLLLVISEAAAAVVFAAPILGPDLNSCVPVIPPRRTAADAIDCCFIDRPIKEFRFNPNLPKRIRRPAHKLDPHFIDKYKRAYELLRALPDDDPRSWHAQSNLHCSYCAAAYSQANSSETLDVHHGWLLFPFHRWYMYFHERILASLIGDDTFALPYWAWDVQNETHPAANVIPAIYTDVTSPLYDERRCHIHQPPSRADLQIQIEPHNKDPQELLRLNYHNMWRVMVMETKTPTSFYGGKFASGDEVLARAGRFETGPHAAVHGWTGSETEVFGEDMAPAYTAARDPIFFAHHSQVDRLWLMWKAMGGRDFDDPDWLDAEFLFYDENADLVRVKVRDTLDWAKFNIEYEPITADWLDHMPASIRTGNPGLAKPGRLRRWGRTIWQVLVGQVSLPVMVGVSPQKQILNGRAVLTLRVARPGGRAKRAMLESGAASEVEEVLVLEGMVTKPFDIDLPYHAFFDLPEANRHTRLDCTESLGVFNMEAVGRAGEETVVRHRFSHHIGVGDRFGLLGINSSSSVEISFVAMWDESYDNGAEVDFTNVRIEFHKVR